MPLTPVMRLVTGRGRFDRFTQTMALQLPPGIDRAGILATLTTVVDHHDALRARLTDTGLDIGAAGSVDLDAPAAPPSPSTPATCTPPRNANSTPPPPGSTRAPG